MSHVPFTLVFTLSHLFFETEFIRFQRLLRRWEHHVPHDVGLAPLSKVDFTTAVTRFRRIEVTGVISDINERHLSFSWSLIVIQDNCIITLIMISFNHSTFQR